MTKRPDAGTVEIAVSGFACRLPGAPSDAAFWRLLTEEGCAVGPIPSDRWSTGRFLHPDRRTTGRSYTMAAGLVDGIWSFDPGFFGISAREAAQMDPQQRMLLETAYEALDAACLTPDVLAESRTGVYVGASSIDHSQRFASDPAAIGAQFMTGNTLSILSNRISHAFDLKGPSYTVDTACSSSFYALHNAAQALAAGEIDTAIVGGVNAILQPFNFVGFSRAAMLSPSGLCRAFDAGADGYVRAEGAVAVVLRRLDAARAAGEPVRAVLMGTAINSDGRTMGLALPSGARQAALLREIYGRLCIDRDRIAFIEAHGTGTPVGDPIEARAIGEVLGRGRTRPLPIGSAKSNVGHLEPASGLVGLVKTALALEHGTIPRSLHVDEVNPNIPLDELCLEVATEARPLAPRADGEAWIAGVNNFGFGGANAHAVLRAATAYERPAPPAERIDAGAALPPLILSAASEASLARLVAAWAERLATATPAETEALAATAAHRMPRHRHRTVLLGRDGPALAADLAALAAGAQPAQAVRGTAADRAGRTVFLFCGNGAQWPGMGCDLYADDPAFRRAFDRVARCFAEQAGDDEPAADLAGLLEDPGLGARIEESEIAQPLIFAIQVALVEALAARGLRPTAVAGHSVGEVAAAWAAGAIALDDAVRLIRVRARAVRPLAGRGGMAAVLAPAADVVAAIADCGLADKLSLAGDNSPRSVTISGEAAAIDEFARAARKRRMALRRLAVAYPYHGPEMEAIREELIEGLAGLAPRAAGVDLISGTTGTQVDGATLDAAHWWSNARSAVRFREALGTLDALGCTLFVEIGPRPVLQAYVTDTLRALGRAGAVLATMEGPGKPLSVAAMAARAVAHGAPVDDVRFFGPVLPARHDRPTYPWEHAVHRAAMTSEEVDVLGHAPDHPLLGWRPRRGEGAWRAQIDAILLPWLADHAVDGNAVMPAAGFAEIALAAGRESLGTGALELRDFDILAPLVLDAGGLISVRTEIERETGLLRIESRSAGSEDDWRLHARGTIRRAAAPAAATSAEGPGDAVTDERLSWTGERLYRMMAQAGLAYGPAFRLVRSLRAEGRGALSELAAPDARAAGDFVLHPASLDAAFHALFPLIGGAMRERGLAEDGTFLPVRLGRVVTSGDGCDGGGPAIAARAQVELTRLSDFGAEADLALSDAAGRTLCRIEGLRLRRVRASRARRDGPVAWHETLIPLAAEAVPEGPVKLPPAWEEPAARIAALGLAAADEPAEPDSGALLADAAARRIAWDALERLAGPARRLGRAAMPGVHPASRALYAQLVATLEADGAAIPADAPGPEADAAAPPARSGAADAPLGLVPECPCPPLATLVEALIAEAPARAADVAGLMRLASTLDRALREGLDALPEAGGPAPVARHAPARRALWAAAGQIGLDIGGSWPEGRRLALLVLGDIPPDLACRLAALPALTALAVSDPARRVSDQLALELPPLPAMRVTPWEALQGPFDVILAGDALWRGDAAGRARLAGLLAPGGVIVAVEGAGELAADLSAGLAADWWRDGRAGGPRLDGTRLGAAMIRAGLRLAGSWPLDRAETHATIAVARRPAATEAAPPAEGTQADDGTPPPAAAIFHDAAEPGLAEALGAALTARGWQVRMAPQQASGPGPADPRLGDGEVGIIAWPANPRASGTDRRIELGRRLVASTRAEGALWLITRGGRPADRPAGPGMRAPSRQPADAALWGFGRVMANEHPGWTIRQIDLDPGLDLAPAAAQLAGLITAPGPERELVLDAQGLAAPRLCALPDPGLAAADARAGAEAGRRLGMTREGSLDTLRWMPAPRRAPGPGEVEIEVAATGLNFRDVMWAQRLLPPEVLEDGFAGAKLGMECAGIVRRAGEGAGLAEGTRVVAFAPAAFASHVTLDAGLAAPLPDAVALEAAAGLPAIFLTAQYGLVELAKLEAGESVLIHGAAGGVGLAAIQIARARGARIFATAGREAKRALVRLLGAEAVFDSRSLAFADEVRAATGGRGVDVVLNSLAGEAMARSVECLAPFGRFVELGKQDFVANSRLGLRPFRQNLAYFGVDADQLVRARPGLTRRLFAGLMQGFADGTLVPPPVQVFEPAETVEAFRLMQRSEHIGKIVIRPERPPAAPAAAPARRPAVSGKGSWLIVGGLGGFGLATALWLARRGARRLWLTGRRGVPQAGGEDVMAELAALGAQVEALAVDASDREAMKTLIARIEAEGSPLEGVIHAAMVLDDAPLAELGPERVARVMRPKAEGAALLDRLTRPLSPRHFVLYSSISTAFGNPGQAAYVAANAALEAIAANRRAEGLPGLAIGWGPISDRGYLARAEAQRAFIERRLDGALLTAAEALDGLGALLDDPAAGPVVRYAPIRWSSLAGDLALLDTPLFERVERARRGGGAARQDLAAEIAGLDDGAARARIVEALTAECARILRQPEGSIDPHRPLASLGFDSLMAVDLKMSAEEELGISLPLTTLGDQMSLADLAGRVLDQLRAGGPADAADATVERLRAQHGDAEVGEHTVEELRARAKRIGRVQ
ncbi:SDR family NAD(P)-dependent oxidoreductase [Limibaculum sp. FT325]|uniref:type I polyketide synthase n=1 Tax=Thermohalobaculum sediminis TaxID=2939436 RepID=UPI0020BDB230|nr:type I polyketide synthase [Limibaculum sediminis]MCL5777706.1 SDR family NAD(P)-dependent oxidoreductase [Limibaculum sediminis]